jgi:hypothetical protein
MTVSSVMRRPGVVFKSMSSNGKLSPQRRVPYKNPDYPFRQVPVEPFCASTYVSITATCSSRCAFKDNGCYVQTDRFMSKSMSILDKEAVVQELDAFDVSMNEAEAIDMAFRGVAGKRTRGGGTVPQDGARGGRDLRLHIGGDVASPGGAMLLGEAAGRWRARGGGRVWTFTHAWREVSRAAFGPSISVLASVEKPEDIKRALRRGFAPAVVVDRFDSERAYRVGGVAVIPCPNETRGKTCVECRLCLDGDALAARGMGIAFAAHGTGKAQVIDSLVQLGQKRVSPKEAA